ncbi:hypothetical protein D3C85_1648720 [compost metagenome]
MWYTRKNEMATTTGNPIPPFLIMAPSGAPIKNSSIQDAARVNLRWYSTVVKIISPVKSVWRGAQLGTCCIILATTFVAVSRACLRDPLGILFSTT